MIHITRWLNEKMTHLWSALLWCLVTSVGQTVRAEQKFGLNISHLSIRRTPKFVGRSTGCSPTECPTMHCKLHSAF